MRTYRRGVFAVSALCTMLLAGCASHPQRTAPGPREGTPPPVRAQPAQVKPPGETGTAPNEQLPPAPDGMIGVAACDQYLSTYKACHRAAGIFAPGQLDARYEIMRDTLLRDSRDPTKRAVLDERCRALSRQLQQALHGRSCHPAPGTSGG